MGIFARIGRVVKAGITRESTGPQLDRRQIISGFLGAHENILLPGAKAVISDLDGQQKLQTLQKLGEILSERVVWERGHNYRIERLTLSLSSADEIRPISLGGEFKLATNKDRGSLAGRLNYVIDQEGAVAVRRGIMSIAVPAAQLLTNGNGHPFRAKALPEGNGHAPVVEIILPEMIALSDKIGIMRGELKVDLFKQVMEGYEITGHNTDKLQAILDDPSKADDALTYVSLLDAREFAKRLSDLTGRKFRVQTEEEWLQARDQLTGNNWTWTGTKHSSDAFVLRRLVLDYRFSNHPEGRYDGRAVRLVEDL